MADNDTKYHFEFAEDELPSRAVLQAVARVRDTDPLDLAPLGEVISPGAVNTLVNRGDEVAIMFFYEGLETTIRGDGKLILRDPE